MYAAQFLLEKIKGQLDDHSGVKTPCLKCFMIQRSKFQCTNHNSSIPLIKKLISSGSSISGASRCSTPIYITQNSQRFLGFRVKRKWGFTNLLFGTLFPAHYQLQPQGAYEGKHVSRNLYQPSSVQPEGRTLKSSSSTYHINRPAAQAFLALYYSCQG